MKYYLSFNIFNIKVKNKVFLSLIDLISFINISDDTYKLLNRREREKIICYRKNINIIDCNIGDEFINIVDSHNNKVDLNSEIISRIYESEPKDEFKEKLLNYEFTDYVINNSRFYIYGSKTLNLLLSSSLTATKNDYSYYRNIRHKGYNKASCDLKYTSDLCYRYYGIRIKASYPKMITNYDDLYASSKSIKNWKKNKVKSQYITIKNN